MSATSEESAEKYRVVIRATEIPPDVGPQAALDIAEFFDDRPWHQNVVCKYHPDRRSLILQTDNDYDETGLALLDEFSDSICASIRADDRVDGRDLIFESVTKI